MLLGAAFGSLGGVVIVTCPNAVAAVNNPKAAAPVSMGNLVFMVAILRNLIFEWANRRDFALQRPQLSYEWRRFQNATNAKTAEMHFECRRPRTPARAQPLRRR
jgi:hypothetical protein